MAAAAGIDMVEPQIQQGWHRGCGNGMIVGNVGMVLVSVLASLKPTAKLEAVPTEQIYSCFYTRRILFGKNCNYIETFPSSKQIEDIVLRLGPHAFNAVLPFQAVLKEAREQQTLLGIPDTLKFHGGWKKWKLAVCDSIHTFQSKDQALDAAAWFQVTEAHLQQKPFKTLADEVKTVGQKGPRTKKDAVAAVLRIRYKKDPMGCMCCVFHKARAKTCGVLKHLKAKKSF